MNELMEHVEWWEAYRPEKPTTIPKVVNPTTQEVGSFTSNE